MSNASPTDHVVASADDLADGEMKEVKAGGAKVLLVRRGETFYAVGAVCPHYGAPLSKGIVCENRIVCPWHKSVFSLESGDVLEPPSPDGLPRFAVRVDGGDVIVNVPADALDKAPPPPMPAGPVDGRTLVVLGAGAAGRAAAETLRGEAGFTGRVVMVGREAMPPYDRTQLSKSVLTGKKEVDDLPIRPAAFYDDRQIERVVDKVAAVDTTAKRIEFDGGGPPLEYDALLLAPGGTPRTLGVPGEDAKNVLTLRTADDAKKLVTAADDGDGWVVSGRVVVVGNGFIGLETAANLTTRGLKVTLVSDDELPLKKIMGEAVGRRIRSMHEGKGVEFVVGEVASFKIQDGRATAATLKDGTDLKGDLFVVGIGVTPATDIVKGIDRRKDGGITVDDHLRAAEGVYAAGDVAAFPDPQTGDTIRVEHWRIAEQHGRVAALNMAGGDVAFDAVPYFWSNQFDARLDYVGHAESFDDVIETGDVEGGPFVAFYVRGGRVLAASAMKRDEQTMALLERMRLGSVPAPDTLRGGGVDLAAGLP